MKNHIVCLVSLFLLGGPAAAQELAPGAGGSRAVLGAGLEGGGFRLLDAGGRDVAARDFRGRAVLLFFGYVDCPDVCPTTLAKVAEGLDLLGPETASRVQPLFVTLDPQRDRGERLSDYVAGFDSRILPLWGPSAVIDDLARRYRVRVARFAEVTPAIEHSAILYLLGPEGRLHSYFPPGFRPAALAETLSDLLK